MNALRFNVAFELRVLEQEIQHFECAVENIGSTCILSKPQQVEKREHIVQSADLLELPRFLRAQASIRF